MNKRLTLCGLVAVMIVFPLYSISFPRRTDTIRTFSSPRKAAPAKLPGANMIEGPLGKFSNAYNGVVKANAGLARLAAVVPFSAPQQVTIVKGLVQEVTDFLKEEPRVFKRNVINMVNLHALNALMFADQLKIKKARFSRDIKKHKFNKKQGELNELKNSLKEAHESEQALRNVIAQANDEIAAEGKFGKVVKRQAIGAGVGLVAGSAAGAASTVYLTYRAVKDPKKRRKKASKQLEDALEDQGKLPKKIEKQQGKMDEAHQDLTAKELELKSAIQQAKDKGNTARYFKLLDQMMNSLKEDKQRASKFVQIS